MLPLRVLAVLVVVLGLAAVPRPAGAAEWRPHTPKPYHTKLYQEAASPYKRAM